MSRSKKTRRIKGKLDIKTGSKKNLIAPQDLGKIPSKNKLAKHKKRPKSAYQKFIEKNESLADTASRPSENSTSEDE